MGSSGETRKTEIRKFIESRHAESWPVLQDLEEMEEDVVVYSSEGTEGTLRNLIAHLADSERGVLGQAQRAAAGKMTIPEDFDLERWNRGVARKSAQGTLKNYKDQILQAYHSGLEFLDELDETSLDILGRHASGEMLTIEGFFHRIAEHRLEHAQDLQQALKK
jgi:hypothetical protein